jgi:hypothetical protein
MTSKKENILKGISLIIEGYDDYAISSDGDVISYRGKKPIILKPQKAAQSKKGYRQVRLFNDKSLSKTQKDKNGKYRNIGKLLYVHRLVWQMFVGEIPKGMTIDHIDGNPSNNTITNLQLLTPRENTIRHYCMDGRRYLRRERDEMIEAYEELKTYKLVAEKFGCAISSVYRIIKNLKFPTGRGNDTHITTYDESIDDDYSKLKAHIIKTEIWNK